MAYTFVFLFILFTFKDYGSCFSDPYVVLSVERTATVPEIKAAYKKLAKEWHPDRNKSPGAEEKFVDINKAYQLLTDPARREEFDRFGVTEDKPNFRNHPQRGFQFEFFSNPTRSMPGATFFKYTISSKQYYNKVIPGSSSVPYLIVFYSGFCIPCIEVEFLWKTIAEDFQPLGIEVACIHADYDKKLARKLGIDTVPYMVGVIDERVKHFRERSFNLRKIIMFMKGIFPPQTLEMIDKEATLTSFLNGWKKDNKIRVLICSRLESIRLRFYTTAFKFRDKAVFAYVQLGKEDTEVVSRLFGVSKLHAETLLVFHEDATTPVASLSMAELSVPAMEDVIEANKFLLLPRLSSQRIFDSLCPPESMKAKKRLCVVLLTKKSMDQESYREAMRDYLHNHRFNKARVRFAYVFKENQKEFVNALSEGKQSVADGNDVAQVVIIRRRDTAKIKYQWLKEGWNIQPDKMNSSQEALEATIKQLLRTAEAMPYDAVLKELADEHQLNIFSRIAKKVLLFVDSVQDKIASEAVLSVLSVVLTFGFILLVGFGMSYLLKIEEEALNQKYDKNKQNGFCSKETQPEPSLKIHELRGETYFGLLRLLKPGFRTIILLLDNESKSVLIPKFFKAAFPYRKNKSLLFAFLNLDRNLDWYRGLLIQALTSPRELNINPKNCIGTVLSINGQRKYFCMYHPKHPEQPRGVSQNEANGGKFLGFEDTESESENSDIESGKGKDHLLKDENLGSLLFEENLLDNLPNWLDRLFEGSTQRYYFQIWPNLRF